jgi:hypothetical protein
LSSNEIRRLYGKFVVAVTTTVDHVLHWSDWRRQRQAEAKTSHYHKRLKALESYEPS